MFTLPKLDYELNALEPYISQNTMEFHYLKHHKTYVDNLNKLVSATEFENMPLEEVIKATAGNPKHTAIFNNAAQAWNHAFFWHCLAPNGGKEPKGQLLADIITDFGSFENLKAELKNAAVSQFGSGWAWLVLDTDDNRLKVVTTGNADTPVTHQNWRTLLCLDVWEHAYYLDYQNARGDFLSAVIDNLLNWKFAADNLQN